MGVLLIIAAIVASVGVGILAERRRPAVVAHQTRRVLTGFLYAGIPLVVFFNLAAGSIDVEHGIGVLLGLLSIALAALLVGFIASRVLGLPGPQTGAVVCAVLAINSGNLGYPMTVALLGRDELTVAVLFDVLACAPAMLLGAFAVAAALGTAGGETAWQRVLAFFTRNPPLFAAIAGLLAPAALAPSVLVDLSQVLAISMLPIGFFAVGATLAESADQGDLPLPLRLSGPVALAVAGRLAVAPGLLVLFAAPLIELPTAYLVMAAMPTAITAMVIAHVYGLDMEITAEAIVWSTAVVIFVAIGSLLA